MTFPDKTPENFGFTKFTCPHLEPCFASWCRADVPNLIHCPVVWSGEPCVADFGEAGAWRASLAYFMEVSTAFMDLSGMLAFAAFDIPTYDGLRDCSELLLWALDLFEEMQSEARAVGWSW